MASSESAERTSAVAESRRHFLAGGAAATASLSLTSLGLGSSAAQDAGGGQRTRLAVVGCGGQGGSHIRNLRAMPDVELAYVCDVDRRRLDKAASESGGARAVSDLRQVLDDNSVEGVVIATPDHWHAPAALLALQAGKHVYVEKPCAHNVRESRLLLDTARKQNRIAQHGTQSRSSAGIQQVISALHNGLIGEVLTARCWNWQLRKDIGRGAPSEPPPEVDYDTWVGPAEMLPFQSNRFHYDWHWWFNFGCGDAGNDGIHEIDLALWGLGVSAPPNRVSGVGGKYFFDDDQEFPDTQQVALEFESKGSGPARRMLIYEQRLWSTNYPENVDSGVEFHGDKGRLFLSKRGKFSIVGPRNKPLEPPQVASLEASVAENQRNWIDCIRTGARPNADLELAHRTATAVHLANISTRLGRTLSYDPASEQVLGDAEANRLLGRAYRDGGHWSTPQFGV